MEATMRLAVLALALVLVSAGDTIADTTGVNGARLWASCNSNSESDREDCRDYASAIFGIMSNDSGFFDWRACFPSGVSRLQLQAVLTKFLNNHPESLHHSGADLAARAYAESFPCPQ